MIFASPLHPTAQTAPSMAHDYLTCRTCGTVSRRPDSSIARLFEPERFEQQACANARCPGKDFDVAVGKTDVAGVAVRQLAQRMVRYGKTATHIDGVVKINYLKKKQGGGYLKEEVTHQGRDLEPALKRLISGAALPTDINNRNHVHDGGRYRGEHLPIQDVKQTTTYYREYGVLSSSRGWEINLSSERLVTGASGEIYYTSLHYMVGSWWVFNSLQARWWPFQLRV